MAGKRPFEIDGANRIPLIGGDGWSQVRQRPGVAELECVGRVKYVYTLSVTIFSQKKRKRNMLQTKATCRGFSIPTRDREYGLTSVCT
jgi:hypothetical protein